ncbi:MAG: hypothetical protein AAFZ17_13535 [Cyanobacteria bacterium J06650_10]
MLMVTVAIWTGIAVPHAQADSIGVGSQKAADVVRQRAASELDRMAGAGTSDQIEGAVQDAIGQTTDDTLDQVKGKVKRDIGKLKGAAADAEESIEDAVKDFLD